MISIRVIASSSKGNCYHVYDGHSSLLLECGIAWKKIQVAMKFKTSSLAGVLVSHSHKDHCHSVREVVQAGIDLYTSKETAEAKGVSGHRVHHVDPGSTFTVGSWTVKPFETVHDAPGSLGFLLANTTSEKLLFLTDSAYCRYTFTGLTHMMLECNFSRAILDEHVKNGSVNEAMAKRLIQAHFSLERVIELLEANDTSKLQWIYLMHLSDVNSDEAQFKKQIQQITGVPVHVC